MAEKQKPLETFRAGAIKATIWTNKQKDKTGKEFETYNVVPTRSYKDKDGNWQDTNSFRQNDLPKVEYVVRKAYEFLITKSKEDDE